MIRTLRTVFSFLLSLLAVLSLSAQDRLSQIERQLRQAPVQEKIYVHMDNTCYFKGDTIWYKAYVVRADSLTYTDMSRITYVELLKTGAYALPTVTAALCCTASPCPTTSTTATTAPAPPPPR